MLPPTTDFGQLHARVEALELLLANLIAELIDSHAISAQRMIRAEAKAISFTADLRQLPGADDHLRATRIEEAVKELLSDVRPQGAAP